MIYAGDTNTRSRASNCLSICIRTEHTLPVLSSSVGTDEPFLETGCQWKSDPLENLESYSDINFDYFFIS
jgi:hypothetical protein